MMLAANGAGGAGMLAGMVLQAQRLAGDRLRLVEVTSSEIPRRQQAQAIEEGDIGDRADLAILGGRRTDAARGQIAGQDGTRRGSAARGRRLPRTAIAFSRFAPITAPAPVRPARRPSLAIAASRTPCSPAAPIAATRNGPSSARRRSAVSPGDNPSSWSARLKVRPAVLDDERAQWGAQPVIASASCPVRFSSSARYDEESESPIMPVCGDRAATAILLEVVMPVPAKGDVAKMRGLSGPSGSAPGGQSRSRRRLANPMPPMTSAKISGATARSTPLPRRPPGGPGAIAHGRHR